MATASFQAPTDYNAEAEDIARRRKYAEMLQAQSMEALPGTQMAGGWAIPQSPLSGLAKMLQAYNARAGMDDATARQRALADRYRTEGNAALAAGLRAYKGAPATSETIMDETANGGEGQMAQINAPAVAGSPEAAMAAWGAHPQTAGMSQALLAQILKQGDPYTLAPGAKRIGPGGQVLADNPKPAEGFSLTPGGVRFGPDGKEIARLPEKSPKDEGAWGEPYNLGGAYVQKNSLTGQIRQAVAREPVTHVSVPPPITAVTVQDPDNPNGTIVIDGRTKQVLGKGPKLTETGKANFKQMTTMQGIGSDLQAAEDLLMGNVRDSEGNVTKGALPTGSGIGAAADFAGSLVGVTLPGAQEADALKVVAGKLVQKVPRFEGPQSDKDVALYKQMAADAGNSSNTRERRLAAVRKMREIYTGYEDGSRGRLVQEQLTNPQRRASDVKPTTDVFNAADAIINGRR